MNKGKKKKVIITIAALVIVAVLILVVGTYAYWQVTKKQTDRNRVGSACLSITFTNENNDIDITDMWPTSESEMLNDEKYPPYEFTITNTCDTLINYTVALESIEDEQTTQDDTYMNYDYIRVKLDDSGSSIYSALDTMTNDTTNPDGTPLKYSIRDTKKLVNKRLGANQSRTHKLKLWIDENTPLEDANGFNTEKYFFGKIKIIAGQGIEEECYAVNSSGVLYSYDADCGKSATIPATVDGKQVKIIATGAFQGTRTEVKKAYTYHDNKTGSTVSSPEEFGYLDGTCDQRTNAPCQLDYSIAMSKEFGEFWNTMSDEDAMAQFMQDNNITDESGLMTYVQNNFDENDAYVIIYYTGSDTEKINAIRDRAADSEYLRVFDAFGWTLHYYNKGSEPAEGDGIYEYFYKMDYTNKEGWESVEIGSAEPAEGTTTVTTSGLMINSLDLSEATYLEKIEERAFSNFPDVSNTTLSDFPSNSSVKTGLTSLTFGNNSRNIELGAACFAKANLDSLTIYNTYKMPAYNYLNDHDIKTGTLTGSDMLTAMNPFAYSTISNLTIKKAGDSTVYDLYPDFENKISDNNAAQMNDNDVSDSVGASIIALYNDTTVTNLTFGSGFTKINFVPFMGIENLTLPDSLTNIGTYAFAGNESFTNLTIPSSVTNISKGAFYAWVGSGKALTIPGNVTTIGPAAFYSFNGSSIAFNSGLTTISKYAFNNYRGANLSIPNTVTTIGECAFDSMPGTITVGSQSLVDSKANWARSATVTLAN